MNMSFPNPNAREARAPDAALLALVSTLDEALEAFSEIDSQGDSYSILQAHRRIESAALAIAATPITGPTDLHLIALATCRYLGKPPNERDLDSCSAAGRSLAAAVIAGALALT
jgi:hypothetical protein